MTINGTNHFTSKQAAVRYYASQGCWNAKEAVDEKLKEGSIEIGMPKLKPGEKWRVVDNGTRFAIEIPD